ncbi:hypothetical protein ACF1AE_05475 [Streptomyces sp. NPDC014986]|uniref:hypothetical protein n=1 Tax=Streptomyces sp. NPDC014986 TaxID=3364934 RepID=UPI0036F8B1B4
MTGRPTEGAQRMSDEAQTPKAREHTAGGPPPSDPHAGDVWPAPADGGADTEPQDGSLVDLGTTVTSAATGTPDPWEPPGVRAPAPESTGDGWRAGGRNDTFVADGSRPWSVPSVPTTPSVHDQQTVTSFPAMGDPAPPAHPAQPWAGPPVPPPDPFASPVGGGPVPPPPVGPEGPGQVPYGYPGGYAAAPAQGYYGGWSGMTPAPSNGPGVTALVLGIISAAVFCVWPLAVLLGVLAMIFGGVGRARAGRGEATNAGQALAGIICGAVGSALGVGFGILVLVT